MYTSHNQHYMPYQGFAIVTDDLHNRFDLYRLADWTLVASGLKTREDCRAYVDRFDVDHDMPVDDIFGALAGI